MITSAPAPETIVRTLSKLEALMVSTSVPPVTVARAESAALVPSVKLLAPLAVVNFSTLEMLSKSASMIVAASALNVIVSVAVPPSIVSAEVSCAPTMVMPSAAAPASMDKS